MNHYKPGREELHNIVSGETKLHDYSPNQSEYDVKTKNIN